MHTPDYLNVIEIHKHSLNPNKIWPFLTKQKKPFPDLHTEYYQDSQGWMCENSEQLTESSLLIEPQ